MTMRKSSNWAIGAKLAIATTLATVVVAAQSQTPNPSQRPSLPATPSQAKPQPQPQQPVPTFRGGTDIISIDVFPRDAKGQFYPNLTKDDFVILEDGVEQQLLNFATANGGRFFTSLAVSAAPVSEGLILPKNSPPPDTASRIFIVFIDDLHFMPNQTPEVRKLLGTIRDTLVHDNDLVGFVSSGFSSIEMDPAYDPSHRRFNEVINKVMGSGPTIDDMIQMKAGVDGLNELNHNVNVAFSTAHDMLVQMEELHGKRKAFIMISNGYSLDPFKDSRLMHELQTYANAGMCDDAAAQAQNDPTYYENMDRNNPCKYINTDIAQVQNIRTTGNDYGVDVFHNPSMEFKSGDLMAQLAELIRSAQRANTMFFPMDPRGLIAGFNTASRSTAVSNQEETEFILQTTGTLRALAENTGGLACVGTNDCRPVLQKIDNMTSDYYMLGYRSSNPDPFKLARKIEVKVKRPGVQLVSGRDYRDMYYLKKPPKPKK
jgi:VWFA-related protein